MATLRRVAPAASAFWRSACVDSGRAAALRSAVSPLPPSLYGNTGSVRSMSTSVGDRRRRLVDASRGWIRDKSDQYHKMAEEFKKADDLVKAAFSLGKYIYWSSAFVVTGLIYLVDLRVERKVNEKCQLIVLNVEDESKRSREFQRLAVRDFQEHVSKTQSSINGIQFDLNKLDQKVNDSKSELQSNFNKLHQKAVDMQEKEIEHRNQMLKAAKFLELNGTLVFSSEEFADLMAKVAVLEQRMSCPDTTKDSNAKDLHVKKTTNSAVDVGLGKNEGSGFDVDLVSKRADAELNDNVTLKRAAGVCAEDSGDGSAPGDEESQDSQG